MSAEILFARAYKAATTVDPLILAQALDHIAKTAARSRSKTRRIRWIEQRALIALRGEEYRDIDVDLPKKVNGTTHEKLARRMAYHIAVKHDLASALRRATALLEAHGAVSPQDLQRFDTVLATADESTTQEQPGTPVEYTPEEAPA